MLVYSTFLGGSGNDSATIAIDASGHIYATGATSSNNFPVTSGVFQTMFGGVSDAFVAKITM